jgi:adenine-specific DNA-methyltransferase
MATGVTKKSRKSASVVSADMFAEEPFPLPNDEERIELSYQGKVEESLLLAPAPHDLIALSENGATRTKATIVPNAVVIADNFFAMSSMLGAGTRASLIYADPPFATGLDFESRKQRHAYDDQFGEARYVEFMRRRLILMREVLTDEGSIYLHIGHQMVAQLKLVMDEVFGRGQFKNLIVRRKCSSKNYTRNQYPNLNDYILFYTKGKEYQWNQPGIDASSEWIDREYTKEDKRGRYKLVPIHAPGVRNGETGKLWRGILPPAGKHWQYTPSKLDEMDKQGEIYWSRNQNPRRKVYLSPGKQNPLTDYWDSYRDAHHQSIAVTGYPTEKNLELLKMIVTASSGKGDVVLDPFAGSGTTAHASQELGRRWIAMDESLTAAEASVRRLRHGSEAMGDYVKKPASKVVDLFSQEEEVNVPPKKIISKPLGAKFTVYCDAGLFKAHASEVSKIARI